MFTYKWNEEHGASVINFKAIFGDEFHRLGSCKSAFASVSSEYNGLADTYFTTEYMLVSYDVPVLMLTIEHDAFNNVKFCTVRFDHMLYRCSPTTIRHVSRFLLMIRALYRHSPSIPTYGTLKTIHDKHLQDETTYILGSTLFHKWATPTFQCFVYTACDFPSPVVTQC